MKIIVLQENLHKAVSVVSKNITSKTQLPILANILLEASPGKLKLATTNLETSISYWIGAQVEEAGALTIPSRIFTELVSTFKQEKVELKSQQNNLQIRCGESEASLAGIDASEYPPLPEPGKTKDAVLQKEIIAKGLPFVLIAASSDEGRPLLTGVRFVEKDEALLMVATDGYRLSLKKLPKTAGMSEGFVIPARALAEAVKLAQEEESQELSIYLSKDTNQIIFTLSQAHIATRLIEGEYPAFERIIPSSFTTRVILDKESFARAVKFAAVFARESANILKMNISSGSVVVSANSPQVGENKTTLTADVEGEGGEMAFNARFLQDLLAVFPQEQVVFEMNGALSPGVFKALSDDSYLHIIMPVRVQG